MTRRFVPALAAVLGLGGAALAQDQPLKINDKQYFEKRGLNVLVFTNEYNACSSTKTAGTRHPPRVTATGGRAPGAPPSSGI